MKKILRIIRWFFGIIFIISGVASFSTELVFGLLLLLLGVSILPVFVDNFKERMNAKKWIVYALPLVLFVGCLTVTPEAKQTDKKTKVNSDKKKQTKVQKETKKEQSTPEERNMKIHFLDVGQGLSVLVQSEGQTLIYDGGDKNKSSFVVAYLKEQGITTIDYLISSHYDEDHVSGLIGCLNAFDVKNVISSDYVHDSKTYQSFVNMCDKKGLPLQYPTVGAETVFGTGKFTILAPSTINPDDSNNNSVAIKLTNGDNSFVFTGDAESPSEDAMCNSGIDLSCDVLVPGHHGSATATSYSLLQKVVPEFAVISCGNGNQYGHPDKDTMDKLQSMNIQVYRTDKQGTVILTSDGTNITFEQAPCNDYTPGDSSDTGTVPQEAANQPVQETPQEQPQVQEPQVQEPVQTESVWISATGEKYHSIPNCGRMNPNNATQMSRTDADARGMSACSKCY